MGEDYVMALSDAFAMSDHADRAALKKAVKYVNFRRSPSDDQVAIQACPELRRVHADQQSIACHDSPVLKMRTGTGCATGDERRLYGFVPGIKIAGSDEESKRILGSLENLIEPTERVQRFNRIWKSWRSDKHFLWVSDIPTSVEEIRSRPEDILVRLGLYHWRKIAMGDGIVMLTLEAGERRKPSWIDADMTFYFRVCPEEETHGYTRCLRTGGRGYIEWIAQKERLSLKDVEVVRSSTMVQFDDPPEAYWEALRQDVESERAAAG